MYTIATRHFFTNCSPSRLFFIFTRAQEGGLLSSQGEAKAQQYIDTLWSSCKFAEKGFSKPSACFYPFEKDLDARNSAGQYAVGQWLVSKVEYLRARVNLMELKNASNINAALQTSK